MYLYKYIEAVEWAFVCTCVHKKMLWAMKFAGFDVLKQQNLVFILSELTVKCVLGFGKFVRIFKDYNDNARKEAFFQCLSIIGFCVSLKILFIV